MAAAESRKAPNIVITGTPGTGKSTHAQMVADAVAGSSNSVRHINVGEMVKERGLHEGYDEEWQSYVVDDDRVVDELEPLAQEGGLLLDWHTSDVFPERWVDLVVVLRCDHSLLWERLEKRGYPLQKIQENNTSEIMQTVLDEAREAYDEQIVIELQSETTEQLESNVERITQWISAWQANRAAAE